MSSLSYKPLRKSVHLTQITDEEIRWKLLSRKRAAEYLLGKNLGGTHYSPDIPQSSIVSNGTGKISNILFTVPGYYDQKNPEVLVDPMDRSHFLTLLSHLSHEQRHYTVLCHATQINEINGWFLQNRIPESDYSLAVSVFNYSIWAQDAYLALSQRNGRIVLAESICFNRDHDMSVANDLSKQTDVTAYQSHLYFQGGNVLSTGQYVLVGMDYIRENEGRVHLETREKVLAAFTALCGKKTIPVGRNDLILHRDRQYLGGGVFQPIFHLDMYVTPTGERAASGKELVFVASPRLAREILGEKDTENDFDKYFDEVAQQLEEWFEIKRMPILPTQFNTKQSLFPRHYYLSYNNAVVENYENKGKRLKNVYLPSFAGHVEMFRKDRYITAYYGDEKRYAALDEGAKKIWEQNGFKVWQMDPLEDLAMSWGSVHCMVKVLSRTTSLS